MLEILYMRGSIQKKNKDRGVIHDICFFPIQNSFECMDLRICPYGRFGGSKGQDLLFKLKDHLGPSQVFFFLQYKQFESPNGTDLIERHQSKAIASKLFCIGSWASKTVCQQ